MENFAIIHFNAIYIPVALSKNVYAENGARLMFIKEDVKFNFSLFLMVKNISTMRVTSMKSEIFRCCSTDTVSVVGH